MDDGGLLGSEIMLIEAFTVFSNFTITAAAITTTVD